MRMPSVEAIASKQILKFNNWSWSPVCDSDQSANISLMPWYRLAASHQIEEINLKFQ